MPSKTKKLILIDGNALMHRAYHALPPLVTKKGETVNAVYGFTSVLLKVIKNLQPDYMICAFDVAGGTFRDKIYQDYKAGRVKPDQEFYDQIPKIKEVVKTLNIPIIEKQGFEADDVIGTLATLSKAESQKLKVVIVTGDLDALQLVDKDVSVYTLRKGITDIVVYNEQAVEERYGLRPDQIIDYKGLRGDPSDNIPGVAGIGEKGATELLQKFESIKKLYQAIEENKTDDLIKPRIKEKLIVQKKEALMSKELATIKRDLEIKIDLKKCVWGDYDQEKLNNLFRELEFYSLINRVEEANNNSNQEAGIKNQEKHTACVILDSDQKLEKFLGELKEQKLFAFQTIADGNNIDQENLKGLLFVFNKSPVYYIPLVLENKEQSLFETSSSFHKGGRGNFVGKVFEKIKPILENKEHQKIGYFFKRDLKILRQSGINLKGLNFDLLIAAYLLNPGKRNYTEEKIIFDYLGYKNKLEITGAMPSLIPALSRGKREQTILKTGGISPAKVANFSHFFELAEKLKTDLKESAMEDLFSKIEMPLIKILAKMETNGIKIDSSFLKILSVELKEKIIELEKKIYRLSGDNNFNINSSKQLSCILFEKMRLPVAGIKKTQNGYSVAAPELDKLKSKHIVISFISEYKELVKLKNTYVDVLPKLINQKTKRLHTTFQQAITSTGRLSSSDPNLQNIPIRTEIGKKIRKAFIAESQRELLSADYSQIELRVIAMIADDKKMKEIFNKNLDIHIATAAEVNQISLEEVTAEMRRAAKALNFGIIYGMGVFGFARAAGIERDRAKEFIENYLERFSGVAKYIEKSKEDAKKKGYAETLFGRRRYLPELNSSNAIVKNSAERMAINMPIQGTAADIMKIAMIRIDKWLKNYNNENNDSVRLLLQVHDELLFSIKKDMINEARLDIKKIMEDKCFQTNGKEIDFPVPIQVDLKVGENWEEMKKV